MRYSPTQPLLTACLYFLSNKRVFLTSNSLYISFWEKYFYILLHTYININQHILYIHYYDSSERWGKRILCLFCLSSETQHSDELCSTLFMVVVAAVAVELAGFFLVKRSSSAAASDLIAALSKTT